MNDYLKIGWNALLTAFVVTLVSGLLLLGMPQKYRATAIVVGSPEDMLVVTSADLLERVTRTAKLNTNALISWQDRWLERRTTPLVLLRQSLSVERDPGTGWISIHIDARDPQEAAKLANATAQVYLERMREMAVTSETKTLLAERVDLADENLLSFLGENPEAANLALRQKELHNSLKGMEQRTQRLESEHDRLRQQLDLALAGDAQSLVRVAAGVQRAVSTLERLRLRTAELSSRYGSQHQKMISINAEFKAAEQLLADEVKAAIANLQTQVSLQEEQLATLERESDEIRVSIERLDQLQLTLESLQKQHESAVRQYESGSLPDSERRYSEAIPPDTALGMNHVQVLLIVFLVAFTGVALLMLFRPVVSEAGSAEEGR